ncbi:hypothetical protein [Cellvibrio sp. BR]|uniref:hypothetical protein n=1 Tax=Cellvibrio sp. BR TaxID=1134474 RepID=UPI00030B1217|nr:hypothetical protein [Cellvibrio sp. BR]
MKKYIIVASIILAGCTTNNQTVESCGVRDLLLTGCMAANPVIPNDLNITLIDTQKTVGYQIQSESLEYDVFITAQCDSKPNKYYFKFENENENSNAIIYQPQWSFFFHGKQDYRPSKIYEKAEYLNLISDIKVAKYMGSHKHSRKIDLTTPELANLPSLCESKYSKIQIEIVKRLQKIAEEEAKLIALVKKSTGLEPMFPGRNQKNFNDLVYSFQTNGVSQYLNKFVWPDDGDYRVAQVLDGRVMLTSYYTQSLPITIITNLSVIEGQYWSRVSNSPLKFIGVTSYKSVLGASKQTVVFQQL